MSKRNSNEYQQNSTIRRGVVTERDPKRKKVKVLFEDEDGTQSYWVDVVSKSSTGVRTYQMPGEKDEVWCAIDVKGEAGCLIGSRYNDKDPPPADSNDLLVFDFPNGSVSVNTAGGTMTINLSGALKVTAAQVVLDADVDLGGEGGQLLHRKGDADSDGDTAVGSASRVRAV